MTFQEIITSFPGGISLDQYLCDRFSKEDLVTFINNYSKCTCCERHQTNRPCSPSDFVEGEAKKSNRIENECECSCRHLSRFICRSIIDTEESTYQNENYEAVDNLVEDMSQIVTEEQETIRDIGKLN
jgi:hypothetical protein